MTETRFLQAAIDLGGTIVRQAFWDEDRCNWVGAQADEGVAGQIVISHAALTPDLYGGTSGIALFLAFLDALSDNDSRFDTGEARRTARGAIAQAISRIQDLPQATALGLYGGRLGVAVAAAWVGRLLGDATLLAHADALARPTLDKMEQTHEFDLISGLAGACVGLCCLQTLLDRPWPADAAVRCADALIARADTSHADWWTWKSPSMRVAGPLTGLSHGAAGVAYALHTVFVLTGETRFRDAASRALAYERRVFDPQVQNWPDLRRLNRLADINQSPAFGTFWCHGAPGIGLARLRAVEILGDADCRQEAEIAINSTRAVVEAALATHTGNYSLCHGLSGNCETLLDASAVLGPDWSWTTDLARRAGVAGLESYARRNIAWPCGTHEGQTPSLLLGLAGIGHFFLRLHDLCTPSLLLPRPEQIRASLERLNR